MSGSNVRTTQEFNGDQFILELEPADPALPADTYTFVPYSLKRVEDGSLTQHPAAFELEPNHHARIITGLADGEPALVGHVVHEGDRVLVQSSQREMVSVLPDGARVSDLEDYEGIDWDQVSSVAGDISTRIFDAASIRANEGGSIGTGASETIGRRNDAGVVDEADPRVSTVHVWVRSFLGKTNEHPLRTIITAADSLNGTWVCVKPRGEEFAPLENGVRASTQIDLTRKEVAFGTSPLHERPSRFTTRLLNMRDETIGAGFAHFSQGSSVGEA